MDLAWDDLRTVLAVSRAGSLSGAARALRVEHSTVYRRLNELETKLGARLFERRRSGYTPTAPGERLVAAAVAMEEAALTALRQVSASDHRLEGTVRLATSELLAVAVLPLLLPAFRRELPGLTLELAVSNASVDLTRREADLALRATQHPPEHLVGRVAAEVRYAVFGAPELLASLGASAPPSEALDLAQAPWLGFDERLSPFPNARWLSEHPPVSGPFLRFDSTVAMARAAATGVGLAVLPLFAGSQQPGLVRVGEVLPIAPMKVWVLRHADLARNARVQAVATFLAKRLPEALAAAEEATPCCPRPAKISKEGAAR
jgi:DNA-binding transcriptional LysR family regulator